MRVKIYDVGREGTNPVKATIMFDLILRDLLTRFNGN